MNNNRIIVRHNSIGDDLTINQNTLAEGVSVARRAANILAKRLFGEHGVVKCVLLTKMKNDGSAIEYHAVIHNTIRPDIETVVNLSVENAKVGCTGNEF